jgi:hypothetical protein
MNIPALLVQVVSRGIVPEKDKAIVSKETLLGKQIMKNSRRLKPVDCTEK